MRADALLLGIETSCDETSVAVLKGPDQLLGHIILSQDEHQVWGGVVPEIAARAHLAVLDQVVHRTLTEAGVRLDQIDCIGVTAGPGLVGALLVGVSWARGAAWALGCPLVGVHHMEAHLFAPVLEDPRAEPPFIALLVSGGHTMLLEVRRWGEYRLLGQTRDDAAGEAYDKVARLLDLPYPGGPEVEALAREGDARAIRLPRPMLRRDQRPEDPDYFDVSFSGLKTAVAQAAQEGGVQPADLAAAFQAATEEVLVTKTLRAVEATGIRKVVLGGGVASNRGLRKAMQARLGEDRVFFPSPRLATDNGAMVARAAWFHASEGYVAPDDLTANPAMPFPGLVARGAPC